MIYFSALMLSLIPIFFAILLAFYWFIVSRFNFKIFKSNLNNITTSILITIFTFQPTIINAVINMASCKEIEDGISYIRTFLKEECDTKTHFYWIIRVFYPSFFFYVIGLPAVPFFYIIVYYRKVLNENLKICKFGFLFNGYLSCKFYW